MGVGMGLGVGVGVGIGVGVEVGVGVGMEWLKPTVPKGIGRLSLHLNQVAP